MAKGNKPAITPAKPVIAPPGKLKNAPSTTGEKSGKDVEIGQRRKAKAMKRVSHGGQLSFTRFSAFLFPFETSSSLVIKLSELTRHDFFVGNLDCHG